MGALYCALNFLHSSLPSSEIGCVTKKHLERDWEGHGKVVAIFDLCSESRSTDTLLLLCWLTLVCGSSGDFCYSSSPSDLP